MDLAFIILRFSILVMLAGAAVLTLGLLVYMGQYKRHINKALAGETDHPGRWIPPGTLGLFIPALVIILGVSAACLDLALDVSHSRLTTQEEILRDATVGHEDLQARISMSGNVAAVLCFPEDGSDASFWVYLNQNSSCPNYRFRLGGSAASVERGACLIEHNGTFILLTCNVSRIAEIRCENGVSYTVDPNSPFVLVIPQGGSLLSESQDGYTTIYDYAGMEVYDEDGNALDLTETEWFEMRYV